MSSLLKVGSNQSRLLWTTSNGVLKFSKDENNSFSGQHVPVFNNSQSKYLYKFFYFYIFFFLCLKEIIVFQLVLITSCSVICYHATNSGTVSSTPSHQIFFYIFKYIFNIYFLLRILLSKEANPSTLE